LGSKSTLGEAGDGGCTPGVVGVVCGRDGTPDGVVVVVVLPAVDEGYSRDLVSFG